MIGTSPRPRVCFIVESGTDVRLVEGLAARVALDVLARGIPDGRDQPADGLPGLDRFEPKAGVRGESDHGHPPFAH